MRRITLWLSWLLMFVMAFEDLVLAGTLGTMGRVVGLALAGCWLLSALALGRIRRPGAIHGLMIGFALWCAASILWSLSPDASLDQTKTYVQLVLLALIVWDLYETPAHLHAGLQAYLLGGWVCLAKLLQAFLGGEAQRRFSVGFFNENTLGFTLALGIPVAWYLTLAGWAPGGLFRGRFAALVRLSNLAFIPAATLGIALTASRSSMLSALLGFGYMALGINRLRRGARLLLFAGAAAFAVYGVTLVPKTALDRLSGTSSAVSDGDWNGRLPIWNEALRMISERPLLGTGVRAFHVAAYQTGSAPHNFVLSIFAELGLVGFALFSGILVCAFLLALRQPRATAAFWLTMLVVWLLNALTHNFEDRKVTWLLFGLIAVGARLWHSPAPAQRAAPAPRRVTPGGVPTPT
jgi:O-antigen ligase